MSEIKTKVDLLVPAFSRLADRWDDEKEYEDFADYRDALRKLLPADFTFVRATSQPFALEFMAGGAKYRFVANVKQIKVLRRENA